MSEKRYKVESYFTKDKRWSNLAFVVDNENAENENCFLNLDDVVALLNQLCEENEQLRQTTKTQQIRIYCQDKEIQKLNEQLNKIPNTIKEVWIE